MIGFDLFFAYQKEITMIKKQKFNIIIILALLIGLLGWGISLTSMKAHAAAPKYYVRSSYSGDCTSWDTACDLQMALSKAGEGDIIWVAAGTYKPTTGDNREATFQLKSGVEIYGGFPENGGGWEQRNWKTHHTILSGDIGAEHNSYHVVTGSDVDESAVLDGFTITGGNADFENLHDYGGGMYNIAGSPSLRNLIFIKNVAVKGGGGMYNASGSEPILEEITFTANTAEYGGGMYNRHCSPSLTEVNFTDNTAEDGGGGIYNNGGSPSLTKSYFTGNTAEDGGGMYNDGSNPSLTEINFSANTAEYGGGMYNDGSSPNLMKVVLPT
jgi:predicted outer membrane repeat protein